VVVREIYSLLYGINYKGGNDMRKFKFKNFLKKHAITNGKRGFFSRLKKKTSDVCEFEISVSDAVGAIMLSDMFLDIKQSMLTELKTNESTDYYKAVISIVKSSKFSMDKLEVLRCLNKEVNSMKKESK
jgi:hypothetical protein